MNRFVESAIYLLILVQFAAGTRCKAEDFERTSNASKAALDKASGNTTEPRTKQWKPLAGRWQVCQFGGDGDVQINRNRIMVQSGQPLTGVVWQKDPKTKLPPLLRDNYELKLVARRIAGFDFFCGLTFPVADQHATLVLGGWGGGITGLSCIDGVDASENETRSFGHYEDNQWYRVRVRVSPKYVQCWIDDDSVAKVTRQDHRFNLRVEMDLCEPLGFAAYECDAEFKDIVIRPLSKTELRSPTNQSPIPKNEKEVP